MSVTHVEFLVEDQSFEQAVLELAPRILGTLSFQVYPFNGKQDLLNKLPNRLAGYSHWLAPDWRIIVLVDRDQQDCRALKRSLEQAKPANLPVIHRIAIEELEAWFFGDWQAVCTAYPRLNSNIPHQTKYRDPDAIQGGTWEALERILKRSGYFFGGLRKTECARTIAKFMDPARNTSPSFIQFRNSLHRLRTPQD